jgi:hypothetical protein
LVRIAPASWALRAIAALQRGAPVADVQQTLGHGNVATTSRYLGSDPDRSCGF